MPPPPPPGWLSRVAHHPERRRGRRLRPPHVPRRMQHRRRAAGRGATQQGLRGAHGEDAGTPTSPCAHPAPCLCLRTRAHIRTHGRGARLRRKASRLRGAAGRECPSNTRKDTHACRIPLAALTAANCHIPSPSPSPHTRCPSITRHPPLHPSTAPTRPSRPDLQASPPTPRRSIRTCTARPCMPQTCTPQRPADLTPPISPPFPSSVWQIHPRFNRTGMTWSYTHTAPGRSDPQPQPPLCDRSTPASTAPA